jgi:hypothetical protein
MHVVAPDQKSVLDPSYVDSEDAGRLRGLGDVKIAEWMCTREGSYYLVVDAATNECGSFELTFESSRNCVVTSVNGSETAGSLISLLFSFLIFTIFLSNEIAM